MPQFTRHPLMTERPCLGHFFGGGHVPTRSHLAQTPRFCQSKRGFITPLLNPGPLGRLAMFDEFAESTALLRQLLEQVTSEKDPVRYDKLSAEIRRVLDERETLRRTRNAVHRHEEQQPQSER